MIALLTRLLLVVSVVLSVLCVRSAFSVANARSAHSAAVAELASATLLLSQLESLRGKPLLLAAAAPDETELFLHAADVLAGAGVPGGSVRVTVTPQGDAQMVTTMAATTQYRRRIVQLDLQPITVRNIGAFLARWREQHPEWVPSRIELSHADRKATGQAAATFIARITLTSTYASQSRRYETQPIPGG